MTIAQIATRLRLLEIEKNIPAAVKKFWLQDMLYAERRPKVQLIVKHVIKRFTRTKNKPKYDIFTPSSHSSRKHFHKQAHPPRTSKF